MKKYLYLAVTADKYQLPIMVEDNAKLLAKKLGIREGRVHSAIYQKESGKKTGFKILKVEII